MLYPVPQADLLLKFKDTERSAIADFGIIDIVSFCRMALVVDKSLKNEMMNSEPQMLAAEAIAAHQLNIEELDSFASVRSDLEKNLLVQMIRRMKVIDSMGPPSSSDGIDNKFYGVRVNGWTFSLYQVPISNAILTAMKTLVTKNETT